jgi:two-component system, OmpR family, sensor histidine kinase KdpD
MSESSLKSSPPKRGSLRIFLGYAAGVGKTYAMLEEAQRRRATGVDIVIGYFEPHGRKATIEKTEGLETIPRLKLSYRGTVFEEMDTEAILARRPQVCVVDEFAHSNVPGSPRAKRWEDVRLIQDAGIDVLTTMNVQHIESLNDQVWQVTGIRVRETIPDWVVEEADEIVMVDLSPRALLHRLERGVVYAPDKALRALENFFTETNLTALRELALRQAAHQVEDHSGAAQPSGSAEKILIHLTADPSTAMLIRRGRRVADYLQTECLAVYVGKDPQWTDVTPEERGAIEKHLGFARSLRIETTILTGRDVAKAVADFARERKVTQLFLGRHSKDARRIVDNARNLVVTVAAARRR